MTKIHTKQQLIEAAERIFLQKGYAATRVEDIGAELGVLQGSLYYHIGSKAGLLRLVLRHRFTQLLTTLEEVAASSASIQDKVRAAVVAQLTYRSDRLPDSPQWFSDPGGPKETKEDIETDRLMVARFREAWKDIIRAGIANGEIREGIDPDTAALTILGSSNHVARWHEGDETMTPEAIADIQIDLLWAGLGK